MRSLGAAVSGCGELAPMEKGLPKVYVISEENQRSGASEQRSVCSEGVSFAALLIFGFHESLTLSLLYMKSI